MITVAPAITQLMFPGQAAAPEGPIDLASMYVMHRAFRRDVDAFDAIGPTVPVEDRSRWALLEGRFALFSWILHNHHHGEDIGLWPLLAERGADPLVLAQLEADHAEIDPLIGAVGDDLHRLADGRGGEAAKARLTASVGRLQELLLQHLAREEREGMALVQHHLTPEDWDRLEEDVFKKDYGPRDLPKVLGWGTAGLDPELLRRAPGGESAVFRATARVMAWRFERREARIFGGRP